MKTIFYNYAAERGQDIIKEKRIFAGSLYRGQL